MRIGRRRSIITIFLITIFFSLFSTQKALAHARIINTEFSDSSLNILFNEEISSDSRFKLGSDNNVISLDYKLDKQRVTIAFSREEFNNFMLGKAFLTYEIISKDGHLVSGVLNKDSKLNYYDNLDKIYKGWGVNLKIIQPLLWFLILLILALNFANYNKYKSLTNFTYLSYLVISISYLSYKFLKFGEISFSIGEIRSIILSSLFIIISFFIRNKIYKIFFILISFSSQALLHGHALALKGALKTIGVGLNFIHLSLVAIWVALLLSLLFRRDIEYILKLRKILPPVTLGVFFAGFFLSFLLNNGISYSSFQWQNLLGVKVIFVLSALIFGIYHHFRKVSLKTIILEILIFILVLLTSSALISETPRFLIKTSGSGNTLDTSMKEMEEKDLVNGLRKVKVSFVNGVSGIVTINKTSDKYYMFMLTLDGDKSVKSIDLTLDDKLQRIPRLSFEIKGFDGHYMSLIEVPIKGEFLVNISYKLDQFTTVSLDSNIKESFL